MTALFWRDKKGGSGEQGAVCWQYFASTVEKQVTTVYRLFLPSKEGLAAFAVDDGFGPSRLCVVKRVKLARSLTIVVVT